MPAVLANHISDLVAIGGNQYTIGDPDLDHTLPNANDQRQAGEETKGLLGEAGRAQTSWDDGERLHASRSVGVALTAAKFTSWNVVRARDRRKRIARAVVSQFDGNR